MTCGCSFSETISNLHMLTTLCFWSCATNNHSLRCFNRRGRSNRFISNNSDSNSHNIYVDVLTTPPGWLKVFVVEAAVAKLAPSGRS